MHNIHMEMNVEKDVGLEYDRSMGIFDPIAERGKRGNWYGS